MAKVLVIDDDEDVREVVALTLEMRGHDVLLAGDGLQGVAAARAHAPDLVFLDNRMPVMDGPAALAAMRADPVLSRLPVVFLTASGGVDARSYYLGLGAVDIVEKPFAPATLLASVDRHARGAG